MSGPAVPRAWTASTATARAVLARVNVYRDTPSLPSSTPVKGVWGLCDDLTRCQDVSFTVGVSLFHVY